MNTTVSDALMWPRAGTIVSDIILPDALFWPKAGTMTMMPNTIVSDTLMWPKAEKMVSDTIVPDAHRTQGRNNGVGHHHS